MQIAANQCSTRRVRRRPNRPTCGPCSLHAGSSHEPVSSSCRDSMRSQTWCFSTMAKTILSTTVAPDNAGRVDLIVRELCETSRSQVRGMVDHGCVSINGVICEDVAKTVVVGDVVSICFDSHQRYKEKKKPLGRSYIQSRFRGQATDRRRQGLRNIDCADRQ